MTTLNSTTTSTRPVVTPLREFLAKCRPPFTSPIHVVVGNEAADLDSISCAIALAYLRQKTSPFQSVPIANIPRSELTLRRDVLLAFSLADISPADVLFIDELPDGLQSAAEITLVDHNALTRHQKDAASLVVRVIDHHADEGQHTNADPRIVQKVGSCATLVADLVDESDVGNLRDVARLLSCALMLDTGNLMDTAKTTPRDEKALKTLGIIGRWDKGARSNVFASLRKARRDVTGMDARDLLRRDLKMVQGGELVVAFASVGMRPEELVKAAGDEGFAGCMERFAVERDVPCVAALVTSGGQGGTQRFLAIMKGEVGDVLQHVLCEEADHDVGMDEAQIEGGQGVWWFRLRDGSMSRKIVAPKVVLGLSVVAGHLEGKV